MDGGFRIQFKKSRVETLTSDKDNEALASKREFKNKIQSLHFTNIEHISLTKKNGATHVLSGDIKGNLIAWKLGQVKNLD